MKKNDLMDKTYMDQSFLKLFFRFLRFGCLAWGGPVAQIAKISETTAAWTPKKKVCMSGEWMLYDK